MTKDTRRRGAGSSRSVKGNRERGRLRFDDVGEEPEVKRPRSGRSGAAVAGGRRGASSRRPAWERFPSFGGQHSVPRRATSDWDYASADEEDDAPERFDDESRWQHDDHRRDAPGTRRGSRRRGARSSLMDLATPIFAYASLLPRDAGGLHPPYAQFRNEVLSALGNVKSEAASTGIEQEDAAAAFYALAAFIDSRVADSEWSGKPQWAGEPLSRILLQDPEAGVNFFQRMDALTNRQREVKEVYFVCLALGYRGMYADLDPNQQAERLGEIKRSILRDLHPVPIEEQELLFPEGYEPAEPIDDDIPPPPRWWIAASVATVVVAAVIWILLVWRAGYLSDEAIQVLKDSRDSAHATAPLSGVDDADTGGVR